MNEKRQLLLALLSQYDENELRAFTDNIPKAYGETLEQCRPLLTRGNSIGATIGIVIALRQLADNITEQAGNTGIPLFGEMVDMFNEGLKLSSVAWTKQVEEDEDGEQ